MAANIQPYIKVDKFSGKLGESFDDFRSSIESAVALAGIDDALRPQFVRMNLAESALRFFNGLPEAVRNDYDQLMERLGRRYNNTDNGAFHVLRFNEKIFDPSKETAEDFLVAIQRLADLAFPDNAAAGVNRAQERTDRIKEKFIQGMPLKYKRKLLKAPAAETVDQLCDRIKTEMWVSDTYPETSYPASFNALQSDTNQREDAFFKKLDRFVDNMTKISSRITEASASIAATVTSQPQRQHQPTYAANWRTRAMQSSPPRQYGNQYQISYSNPRSYAQENSQPDRRYPRSPIPARDICRNCGRRGHTQGQCWQRPAPRVGESIPFPRQPKN